MTTDTPGTVTFEDAFARGNGQLPPKPSGGWTWDDLTPSERSLLHPPAWMRPCPDDHGRER